MYYDNINTLLFKLSVTKNDEEKTVFGIELANEVLKIFGAPENELRYGDDVLNDAFPSRKFKHQKMETWFSKHPYLSSARIALIHFNSNKIPVESKFYKLSESSNKAKISATTQIDSNWEDGTLTMKPQYKVGIDFFLSAEGNSLLIVLTNRGNLRVLELSEKLSKTQIEIFSQVKGCFLFNGINPVTGLIDEFEPQRTIHRNLWNSFALQEVNRKFYLGVADHFEELVQHLQRNLPDEISITNTNNDAKLFATRLMGRLLFLWFLKKKDVINSTFNYFELENEKSTEYYESKLKKLFFSVLNTPIEERTFEDIDTPYLNGGLFDPHPSDWIDKKISYPLNWFTSLYEHFNSFNFTTDESSPDYEQIAIDPEMLGRVFENLLATIVPETSSAASEKKNKGAFYTPREIVDYMSKESLKNYLKQSQNNKKDEEGIDKLIDMNDSDFLVLKSTGAIDLWGNRTQEVRANLIQALNTMRVLDPACGSGAFPIGLLQLIVRTYERLSAFYDKNLNIHRPIKPNEKNDVYETKLSIIQNNLFGSDIEPMAIEISKLRSWLSLVVDDKGKIDPLPNLDFNFVCANSLVPLDKPLQINMFEDLEYEREIDLLRDKYFQIHDKKSKLMLKAKFANLYNTKLEEGRETKRVQQLKSWNPFEADKPAEFFDPKIMFNVEGFHIVIGNPPYIKSSKIDSSIKGEYKKYYVTAYGSYDIFSLFFEMAFNWLEPKGIYCYITSNKYLIADYAKPLRELMMSEKKITRLIDLADCHRVFESALVSPAITLGINDKYDESYVEVAVLKNDDIDRIKSIDFSMTKTPFSIHLVDEVTNNLMNKIRSKSLLFDEIADIRTGVMGFDYWSLEPFVIEGEKEGFIRLVTNGFVDQYLFSWGEKGRLYKKDFYEPYLDLNNCKLNDNTKDLFTKRKLIIRGVAQRLTANLDTEGFGILVAVHSAIILNENQFDSKYILALLNSKLLNWVHLKEFYSARIPEGSLKYPISFIKKLPIFKATLAEQKLIVELVDELFKSIDSKERIIMTLDDLIMNLYGLTDDEKKIIRTQ